LDKRDMPSDFQIEEEILADEEQIDKVEILADEGQIDSSANQL